MWWNVLSLKIWLLKIYRQIRWSANLCSWFLWTVSVGLAYIFLFLFSYLSSLQSFYPLLAIPTNTVAKMKLLLLKCRKVCCSDVSHNMLFYFYFDFFENPHRVFACDLEWASSDILWLLKSCFLTWSGFDGNEIVASFSEREVPAAVPCLSSRKEVDKLLRLSPRHLFSHFPFTLLFMRKQLL